MRDSRYGVTRRRVSFELREDRVENLLMAIASGPIILPLDGSKNAENALPWAAALATAYARDVEFIHVVDHEGARNGEQLRKAEGTFASHAAELASEWGIAGHRATILQGAPAAKILGAAAGASFITIASHGHGGFRATFLGSVADKVVRGATVPIVLVPGVGGPALPGPQPVLVGVDGSEAAEQALRLGREVAQKLGAPVALMRAWAIPPLATASFYPSYIDSQLVDSLRIAAEEYVASVAQPGEQTFVAQGLPAVAIAEAAGQINAGLVVVASSGKGLAARIALGSTTDRLMHSLHRPLLIVPVTDQASPAPGTRGA